MVRLSLGKNHEMDTDGLGQREINTLSQVADEINDNMEETLRLASAYDKLLQELEMKNKLLKEKDDQLMLRKKDEADDIVTYKTKQARVTAELQALVDKLTGEVAIKDGDIQLRDLDISDKERKIAALSLSEKEAKESEQRAKEDHASEVERLNELLQIRGEDIDGKDVAISELRDEAKRLQDVVLEAENAAARAERYLARQRDEEDAAAEAELADDDDDEDDEESPENVASGHAAELAEKDAQIYTFEMAVTAKDDALEDARRECTQLERRIAALEEDLREAVANAETAAARAEEDAETKVQTAVAEEAQKATEVQTRHEEDIQQYKRLVAEADRRADEEHAKGADLQATEKAREERYCAMVVELEQALSTADRAAKEIEAVKDQAEDERNELQGDLERMAGEANERSEALREMNSRVASLLTEVDEAKAEVDTIKADTAAQETRMENLVAEKKEAEAEHARAVSALRAAHEEELAAAVAAAVEQAEKKHKAEMDLVYSQQDALVSAATDEQVAEAAALKERLEEMAATLEKKDAELDRVGDIIAETEQKHVDMVGATERAKLRADKAVEDKAHAEASFARELDRLAAQLQERTDELQVQSEKNADVAAELREAKTEARRKEAKHTTLVRQVEDAKAELDNAQRRGRQAMEDLQKDHARQLEAGSERTSRMNGDALEKDARIEELEMDLKTARDEMNDAADKAAALEADLKRTRDEAEDTEENLQNLIALRNQQLLAKESALEDLELEVKTTRDAVRDANHRANDAERQADRSAQDLRLVRATMQAEVIRQGAALEAASYKAREAILQGQQQKADNVQLAAKNTAMELDNEELSLQKEKLEEENARLRAEVDVSRSSEGELQIQIRKMELRNTQQDAAISQMKQKLQEHKKGIDSERADVEKLADAVQQATDRLRDANTKIEHIFLYGNSVESQEDAGADGAAPIALSKSGRIVIDFPVVPHHERDSADYEEAVLPDEVDKVEGVIDQLAALMEVHHWERQEDATRAAQDKLKQQEGLDGANRRQKDLEEKLRELDQKYQDELARRALLEKIKELERAEDASRAHILQNEEDESEVLASGARVGKLHHLQNQLEQLQYSESDARLDIEDLEAAEWNLLMNDAEDEYDALIEQLRRRRLRELKQREKQKKTAYMGLEVSDGIVLKANKHADGRKLTMMMNGKTVNTDVEGVRIFNVAPNGPADLAGLTPDDVILRVDGKKTLTLGDFKSCAKKVKPGDAVQFKIWRDGEEVRLPVQTIEVNEDEFEQGTRRRMCHRVTVLKEMRGDRNQAREAREQRRKELRSSMSRLGRVSTGSAVSGDGMGMETVPQDFGSPASAGTTTSPPKHHDCATHTLAGAGGGPMTQSQFTRARGNSGFKQYNEMAADTKPGEQLMNKRVSTASPRLTKEKSQSPAPFLRERTNSMPDFMRPTKSAAQRLGN